MSRRQQFGFTLVEVLVALAVVAIAFTAILTAMAHAIDVTTNLRERNLALWVAQNRWVQHRLTGEWPAADTKTGTADMGGREWRWQEQVSTTGNEYLRRIEITVQRAEDEQVLALLEGLLPRPQQTAAPPVP